MSASTGVKVGIAWLSQLCETGASEQIECKYCVCYWLHAYEAMLLMFYDQPTDRRNGYLAPACLLLR